ncbi:Lysophospholipase L1 [Halopelagius inordinatus]|uniref:Lysophospholipase L1 n=1 Tax=Halopelagius inordinatus TaxID=553467 RepID=A0A1I2VSZ1_9EURY|nr:SGNH/GDSL hydrolase family protein [Halopelagius inordinatus]SFG92270.1 Lysophospholipase L1 [Halopelagius inordinatus]
MDRHGIQFHNVQELRDAEGDGDRIQRVPEDVRTRLNDGARTRMCHPAGVELRFVSEGPVRVTLSSRVRDSTVRPFWGDFQASGEEVVVGEDPTTVELELPEQLTDLRPSARDGLRYDPRVCRLVLPGEHRGGHVRFHGVEGDVRPPTESELPSVRYLAYGTSITEGEAPVSETLTYVNQAARRLGADPINLGSCGSAYCDEAMAEHIAGRDDWDVATLSISVNMLGTFSVDAFRNRAAAMVDAVAGANPNRPVACITIFPNARDYRVSYEDDDECERFRDALRTVVAESDRENVHLLEGPDLLPTAAGLTTDLGHPGDDAMIRIGENLARELKPLLADADSTL